MKPDPRPRSQDRINLRLPAVLFEAIDQARAGRPGRISRNTWIAEAIGEKLARDARRARRSSGTDV